MRWLPLVWLGCAPSPTPSLEGPVAEQPPRVVPSDAPGARVPLASVLQRLDGSPRCEPLVEGPLSPGPWRYGGTTRGGMHRWVAELPYRPRGLFFGDAEAGLTLSLDGTPLPFDRFGTHEQPTFTHDHRSLYLYTPQRTPPEQLGALELAWPQADARQAGLQTAHDEAITQVRVGSDELRGVYLGCGGGAEFAVSVPADAPELSLTPLLVPPEVQRGARSDGARLAIAVHSEDQEVSLAALPVSGERVHLDLQRWAGRDVRLTVEVLAGAEPKATHALDYVFLGDPVVHTRQADPRRVVMVFVDTLRADHLTQAGYDRDTTEPLQPLFDDGVYFRQARSVAPWTLPSARTALTGFAPERFDGSVTLAEQLADDGWATAFVAGNLYLSSEMGVGRGFATHRVELWPSAAQVTDDALAWLADHDGRDALLQVHYMDPHLPYLEPPTHRTRYASEAVPEGLREQFHVSDVRKVARDLDERGKQWIVDRYDNNVRYTAEHVARLLESLDDDDIVVLYSDHGEEFFEHGGFEHGHQLFDELLRVPLVVKAPDLPGGVVVDAPASLLDIAPTVLELLGIDPGPRDGQSLVPAAQGQTTALTHLADRRLAFGRTLYGTPSWALWIDDHKWMTSDGREQLFDLAADPAEQQLLAVDPESMEQVHPYRAQLPAVLGREVVLGWRFEVSRAKPGPTDPPHHALCTVPGGIADVVVAEDPLGKHVATTRPLSLDEARALLADWETEGHLVDEDDEAVLMEFSGHGPEVVVAPERPMEEVGHQVRCSSRWCVRHPRSERDCPVGTLSIPEDRDAHFGNGARTSLARAMWGRGRHFVWGLGIAPKLDAAADLHPPELRDALEAIGYTEPDAPQD